MTDSDSVNPLDADFFDRIVDGGLPPSELRIALDRLDRDPNGWKRCALFFIEAQCWRESFRAHDQPAASCLMSPTLSKKAVVELIRRRSPVWRTPAIAAGIAIISFAMGWIVHPRQPLSKVRDGGLPDLFVSEGTVASHPGPSQATESSTLNEEVGEFARLSERKPSARSSSEDVVAIARVQVSSGGETAEVPILAGPNINEQWLRNQPPRLSEHQQALLERNGFQVDQHRRLLTGTLADGRRVTVPIDQVNFRYKGNDPL